MHKQEFSMSYLLFPSAHEVHVEDVFLHVWQVEIQTTVGS